MKRLILITCLALLAQNAQSQVCKSLMDTLFYGRHGLKKLPKLGVSIAVIINDSVYYYGWGNRDRDTKQPIDSNTVFEIGSNTKVFTALLLAHDMEQNKIKTNEHIDGYLPRRWSLKDGVKERITFTDLASFSSGLPTVHDDAYDSILFVKDSLQPYANIDNDFLGNVLQQTDTLSGYGQYNYSNFNYALLGAILEHKHKTSYDKLLRREILYPLHMQHTWANYKRPENSAGGYDEGDKKVGYLQLGAMASAGIIKSNACDLVRFLKAQINPGDNELGRAIKLSQQVFLRSSPNNVGLGWHIADGDEYVMFGDTVGNSSAMGFNPDKKIGVVVLMNWQNSDVRAAIFNYIYDGIAALN
jgi:CubicO group peptidase (beta-lactamase class C family)